MLLKKKGPKLSLIPISQIRPSPFQPRVNFDEAELMDLADSIRKNGVIQPLVVRRREDGGFELIAGERRLRAARFAGLKEVPCVEQTVDDRKAAVLCLIENLQRRDLTLFEEAEGIRALMNEWGLSQYETAVRLGKSQSAVANKLRLLRLNPDQRARIVAAGLSERHARALLRLIEDKERDDALNEIIARQLSVRETEEYIEALLTPPVEQVVLEKPPVIREHVIRDFRIYVNTLSKAVDTIRRSGLDARADKTENDSFIRYTVIIPKERRENEQMKFDI
ncbi:MAG: ParB/RepB/Spo0J family partition protein [Clostridia bacterium]|nr:ParB/RepB/Spo0J family partition protein [Clostridia bacterium]MBQ5598041.1 ParB/RepB/Spo0J family partition protein [Clostridia bacterium]MBQ5901763.1 ParB/RepB/Spo0J family partition protein [Clostridia bacterium]